jgi:hypothetical protein
MVICLSKITLRHTYMPKIRDFCKKRPHECKERVTLNINLHAKATHLKKVSARLKKHVDESLHMSKLTDTAAADRHRRCYKKVGER